MKSFGEWLKDEPKYSEEDKKEIGLAPAVFASINPKELEEVLPQQQKLEEKVFDAKREADMLRGKLDDPSHFADLQDHEQHPFHQLHGRLKNTNYSFAHVAAIKKYTYYSSALNRELYTRHKKRIREGYNNHTNDPIKSSELSSDGGAMHYHASLLYHHNNGDTTHNTYGHVLDHLTRHHEPTKEHLTLYTGLGFNPQKHISGKGYAHFPAYTSATISPRTAAGFASATDVVGNEAEKKTKYNQHVLRIHWPKGSNGAYVDHHSVNPGEREFLLPRGITLKINKTPKIHTHTAVHFGRQTTQKVHVYDAHPVLGHKFKVAPHPEPNETKKRERFVAEDVKSFGQWKETEGYTVPNADKALVDIPRHEMPQIVDHDAMVKDMHANGIRTFDESGLANHFIPVQKEFEPDKVTNLINKIKSGGLVHPFVVSKDNVIIDGNHRFIARANHTPTEPLKVFKINLNFDTFRDFVKGKPYIKYKNLDDKVVK